MRPTGTQADEVICFFTGNRLTGCARESSRLESLCKLEAHRNSEHEDPGEHLTSVT